MASSPNTQRRRLLSDWVEHGPGTRLDNGALLWGYTRRAIGQHQPR
jgi:hypothetical protein